MVSMLASTLANVIAIISCIIIYNNNYVIGFPYTRYILTVKPPIVDPLREGQCIVDLSTRDTARAPKYLLSL